MRRRGEQQDHGFTLVELLVVVVILGILASVVTFAVGQINDRATSTGCDTDRHTLQEAEETYNSQHETYATEDDLVAEGLLSAPSTMHDITLTGSGYSLDATGSCA